MRDFGVFHHKEAANLTYLEAACTAPLHRGQESAGIVSTNGTEHGSPQGNGMYPDIFDEHVLKKIKGTSAIGHVRYSTAGSSHIVSAVALAVEYSKGFLSVAHNGNLTNAKMIKEELEHYGSIFQSSTDTRSLYTL